MRHLLRAWLRLFSALKRIDPLVMQFVIASLVGVLGALTTYAFRLGMTGLENLFFGQHGSLVAAAEQLSSAWRVLVPMLGGIVGGLLLMWLDRPPEQRKRHVSDYIEAVTIGDGRLDLRSGFAKILASLVVVCTGGAVGREGAMVLWAALSSSIVGRPLRGVVDLRLIVACGTAAGFASAYHAPLASALFVAEVLLGSLALSALGPVVISATLSLLTHQMLTGETQLYQVSAQPAVSFVVFGEIALLGVVAGCLGPLFLQWLVLAKRGFSWLKWPPPLVMGLGGLIVGLLSIETPQVWGNGYSVVQHMLLNPDPWRLVLLVLCMKLLAVGATTGSGSPGGVFTPTLFVGASFGTLAAYVLAYMGAYSGAPSELQAYTLAGMAVFLAATTHAPVMAALMVFEMTGQYQMLASLLPACVLAAAISHRIRAESVYR